MITHEAWYKEAQGFEQQLVTLLRKVEEEGDSAVPELENFLRRSGLWERVIIPRAKEEVIPEEALSGGWPPAYNTNPPPIVSVSWWEQGDPVTTITKTWFDARHFDFGVQGETIHTLKLEVADDLEEAIRLDSPYRPYDEDLHLDLPTLESEWEEIARTIALGDTGGNATSWTAPGYDLTDIKDVDVVSFGPDPEGEEDRAIEGPNYDEWFQVEQRLVFKVKWEARVPLDKVVP